MEKTTKKTVKKEEDTTRLSMSSSLDTQGTAGDEVSVKKEDNPPEVVSITTVAESKNKAANKKKTPPKTMIGPLAAKKRAERQSKALEKLNRSRRHDAFMLFMKPKEGVPLDSLSGEQASEDSSAAESSGGTREEGWGFQERSVGRKRRMARSPPPRPNPARLEFLEAQNQAMKERIELLENRNKLYHCEVSDLEEKNEKYWVQLVELKGIVKNMSYF